MILLAASLLFATAEVAAADPPPPLPESVRAGLWESEHAALLLEQLAFPRLAEALVKADPAGLRGLISKSAQRDFDMEKLGAEIFNDLEPKSTPRLKFRVLRLEKSGEGAWAGHAQLRLWGRSPAGAPFEKTVGLAFQATLTDAESARSAPWLDSLTLENSAFQKSPAPYFKDVTAASGLEPDRLHDNWDGYAPTVLNTGGIYVEDFDRDGNLDILVTDIRAGLLYYKSATGGKFTDETHRSGLPRDRVVTAAIVDLDSDGWPDVITASLTEGLEIWRNHEGAFQPIESNLQDLAAQVSRRNLPTALVPADCDRDGRPDLYLARTSQDSYARGSLIDGESGPESAGQLLRATGDFQFEDVTETTAADVQGLSTFAAAWFYQGDDPFPDLFLAHEFGRGVMLENTDGKKFTRKRLGSPGSGFGSMGLAAGDIDGDQQTDLYLSSMYSKAGSRVLANIPAGIVPEDRLATLKRLASGGKIFTAPEWTDISRAFGGTEVGWSWGVALADFDNDSAPDLFVTSGFVSRDRAKPDG